MIREVQSISSINWNNYKITANDEVYQNISSALSDTGTLITTLIIVITAVSIVNLYLTSCVQYFAFAAAMVFCGKAARRVLAIQSEVPVQVTPYMLNPPVPITPRKLSRRRTIRILRLGDSGKRKNK